MKLIVFFSRCNIHGIQTCLPIAEVCIYSPDSCEDFEPQCGKKTWSQKREDCFGRLWKELPDRTARLCSTNTQRIDDLDNEPDEKLFDNFWFFKHLSFNISICQDQVSARLISCRRNCSEHDTESLKWITCSTGRCITALGIVPLSLCNGYAECKEDGDDESFEQCFRNHNYFDYDEYYYDEYMEGSSSGAISEDFNEGSAKGPTSGLENDKEGLNSLVDAELELDYGEKKSYKLCAEDNNGMLHFPCYKSGKCIPPSLVSLNKINFSINVGY